MIINYDTIFCERNVNITLPLIPNHYATCEHGLRVKGRNGKYFSRPKSRKILLAKFFRESLVLNIVN